MMKPRKIMDFLTCTVQEGFRDVSVVISGNKPQMESAIIKSTMVAVIKILNKMVPKMCL